MQTDARDELAGAKLEDGQTFTVFTLEDGKIARLRGHVIVRTHWRKRA